MTFLACPPKEGNLALAICSRGYDTLVFSVIEVLLKSTILSSSYPF
jgi:hypothetical protein